ncbi:RES family NAD+ phosphorylase [Stenotrophomonas sp.]|uniref:RES family NAD+ phosphorylase n=1 Tax=Stenotrophomonas sp. TaxID=69392 RepID=UPI0028ABCECD|nr:RES family NAD+ phosphorylase [Stenotrophomonas sp.]
MSRLIKAKKQLPPRRRTGGLTPSLLVLDTFSEKDLDVWAERSADLDEYYRILHYSLEPERQRRMPEMQAALLSCAAPPVDFERWSRIVEARWTLEPLSCAGGLLNYGGRFSVGTLLDTSLVRPFPALYIGENFETAYREMHQCEGGAAQLGLSPEDLNLGVSTTHYRVRGHVDRVFDVGNLLSLGPFCAVLKKFSIPQELKRVSKRLKLGPPETALIRTPAQLMDALQVRNWRTWATQFDLPAPSQHFGAWLLAAGFEAIRYRSTKNPLGTCLCVFPDNLTGDSFVELVDPSEPSVVRRMDSASAAQLSGRRHIPTSQL